ncbi:MAG: M6 family metalloprotease domain-containing protein [bacterium]
MKHKPILFATSAFLILLMGTCFGICPPKPEDREKFISSSPVSLNLPSNLLHAAYDKTVDPQGTCHILVLLVDFHDKPGTHPVSYFETKLFGTESNTFATYFKKNSGEKFKITGDVYGWIRSDCLHSQVVNRDGIIGTDDDYGLDRSGKEIDESICRFPLNIWGLVSHVIDKASKSIDLAPYDTNQDGWLDALMVIHSGLGAEFVYGTNYQSAPDYIWSMKSSLEEYEHTRNTVFQNVRIGAFIIVPEFGEIGTFAHEFCHLLGLPDLYDTQTGGPVVGPFCLMDQGSWNGPNHDGSVPSNLSAPMKYFLGWLEPQTICIGCGQSDSKEVEISPQSLGGEVYQALSNPGGANWSPKGTGFGEYFLVENRQKAADQFDAYLPGSGLLIWKIDESQRNNNDPENRLVALIEADANGIVGQEGDFWPGPLQKEEFTPYTNPSSSLRGGRFSGVAITEISHSDIFQIKARISVGVPRKGSAYAFPNPYRIGEETKVHIVFVPEAGPERFDPGTFSAIIFDIEGNFIRRLDQQDEILENGTALWDTQDENGKQVGPGLYFFFVNSHQKQASGTVLIKP